MRNNWSYEEEMNDRERRRVLEGEENQCSVIGDSKFEGRCCPSDGESQCSDCPFKEE
jgi:hypothetical protein